MSFIERSIDRLRRLSDAHKHIKYTLKFFAKPYLYALDKHQQQIFQDWLNEQHGLSEQMEPIRGGPLLLTIVVPVYNTPKNYFWEMIESVLAQTYKNWELILIDDASTNSEVAKCMRVAREMDSRITTVSLKKNQHIAGATNVGINRAKGEFIALLDHDDILHPAALAEIYNSITINPKACLVYTDEAKMYEHGQLYQPFCKPDWNFELLRSINYITHFTAIRSSILKQYGGEDGAYNGTQDWELFLRITRQLTPEEIIHVPKILYYWRVHELSTASGIDAKPYLIEAQRRALEQDLNARNIEGIVVRDPRYGAQWQIHYQFSSAPKLAIITEDKMYIPSCFSSYPVLNRKKVKDALTYDIVAIIESNEDIAIGNIDTLMGDCLRSTVGCVIPQIKNESLFLKNLRSILGVPQVDLISKLTRRSFVRHVYHTTRYNLGENVEAKVILVQSDKLALLHSRELRSIQTICKGLHDRGYSNVYNPYEQMVK